jgi:DnaJ-class molecular chaperone
MNYLLCALAYGATVAVIIYGFSKLRRTCPTCKGKGASPQHPWARGGCPSCNGEGKL